MAAGPVRSRRPPPRSLTRTQIGADRRDGCLVAPDVLSAGAIAALRRTSDAPVEASRAVTAQTDVCHRAPGRSARDPRVRRRVRRIGEPHRRAPIRDRILRHPRNVAILRQLIGLAGEPGHRQARHEGAGLRGGGGMAPALAPLSPHQRRPVRRGRDDGRLRGRERPAPAPSRLPPRPRSRPRSRPRPRPRPRRRPPRREALLRGDGRGPPGGGPLGGGALHRPGRRDLDPPCPHPPWLRREHPDEAASPAAFPAMRRRCPAAGRPAVGPGRRDRAAGRGGGAPAAARGRCVRARSTKSGGRPGPASSGRRGPRAGGRPSAQGLRGWRGRPRSRARKAPRPARPDGRRPRPPTGADGNAPGRPDMPGGGAAPARVRPAAGGRPRQDGHGRRCGPRSADPLPRPGAVVGRHRSVSFRSQNCRGTVLPRSCPEDAHDP